MNTSNNHKKEILEKLIKEMERLNQKIENVKQEIQTLLTPENTLWLFFPKKMHI